jgi:mxaJ protein
MCSRSRRLTLLAVVFALPLYGEHLRVCADPNNLPFSNNRLEGFENKIANVIAADLGMDVEYTWWAQRRGFVRNTLKAGKCDVILGIPSSFELAMATRPYYRSSYVFVTRRDRALDIKSFDDPRLQTLKIGVQLIGDDGANAPPAHALTKRGIVRNVVGFTVYGDYRDRAPQRRIVDAVANGDIDVAIVWGPTAGYFIGKSRTPLIAVPVSPQIDLPFLPFVFDISVGVRRGDDALKDRIEGVLRKRRSDIDKILESYGVPRVDRVRSAS